ncbi:MAG: patatin family protein, partial [Oscillospiraceae bacterium]|nr:patatin family protein [Oscillospiraceae bacterium]
AYPKLIEATAKRHIMYNRQLQFIDEQRIAGNAFVIRPPMTLPINRISHSAVQLQAVYQMGRQTALSALPALEAFLRENGKQV